MSTRLLPPLIALTLIAGCAKEVPAHGCKADAQCPSGSRCTSSVCTGDTRPTAEIAEVGPIQEYVLVRLDGSASADPDGDLSEHHWSLRAVDAPCAPPEVSGLEPVAQVRFGCAGRYEATLVVRDALGIDSDPVRTELVVQPSTASPIVTAGPDLAADHGCGGEPLRCRLKGVVQLTATAAPGVSLRWTVRPPSERPLDAQRRVTFSPSATEREPVAEIVTDGTAISGDWVFRVEAVDAYGVLGAAHTRVSVRNRPPIVSFAPTGPFAHVFDSATSTFTSQGTVAWSVIDPDGDPVEQVTGIWRHVGDGDDGIFDGDFDGTGVSFVVGVPYALPADALKLRGGAGLVRQIELHALDVNRTVGLGSIPIQIGNRPPNFAGGTFDTTVSHRFDAERSRYVALVRAGTFVDPDGDPIVDSVGPGLCGTLHARGNNVTVECAVTFEGVPIVDQLVGTRTFTVAARDPWDAAIQVPVRTVEIRNTPPTITAGVPSVATTDALVTIVWDSCRNDVYVGGAEFDNSVDVSDPDGDPVLVTASTSPGGTVSLTGIVLKAPATVPIHILQANFKWHCWKGNEPPISIATASDGASPVTADIGPRPNFHM